jgi:hypothetical protein
LPFREYGGIFDRFLTARAALAIYSFNQFQVMLCEELLKDVLRLLHAEKYRRPVLSRRALVYKPRFRPTAFQVLRQSRKPMPRREARSGD